VSEVTCDYCGKHALLVPGTQIYPHRPDLARKHFWYCGCSDAYVGCHEGPENRPLGRLANKELREWKKRAHAAFDPIWKSGRMRRREAYARLSKALELSPEQTHIGMFNVDYCKRVIQAVQGQWI
jgi:hypothetical protein